MIVNNSSKVNVIIPCLNEAETLDSVFESVMNQTLKPCKIYVADGGSSDGSLSIIKNWSRKLPIQLIHNSDRRQAPGLNQALSLSESQYIARLDAHSYWNEQYLEILVKELEEDPNIGAAGGVVEQAQNLTDIQNTIWKTMVHPFCSGGPDYRNARISKPVSTLQAPVYRTKIFQEIGKFREDIPWAEDDEFHYRMQKNKWSLKIFPKAKLYYYPRDGYSACLKQFYNYGIGRATLANEEIFPSLRHKCIDSFLLIWSGLLFWNPIGWTLGAILTLIYILTGIFQFWGQNYRHKLIPIIIAATQLFYWVGWFTERNFNRL